MGTPTQVEGLSRVDKSHKAALSDIVLTDRDPRSKNLPISQGENYQSAIILASYDRGDSQFDSTSTVFTLHVVLAFQADVFDFIEMFYSAKGRHGFNNLNRTVFHRHLFALN